MVGDERLKFIVTLSNIIRIFYYEILGNQTVIIGCFDGRRDMQLLLERRLLR